MKRSISTFTTAIAAAALLALPASGAAQTPPPTQPPAQPPAAAAQTPAKAPASSQAAEHLAKAEAALNDIQTENLSARAKNQVAELKKRVNTLQRTVADNDKASATGSAARSPQATSAARGNASWGTEVAAIDKTLTAMIGPEPAAATTPPAATGTTGTPALDDATKTQLTQVRTQITAFAAAMAGGTPAPESTPASDTAAFAPATSPATSAPPMTGSSGVTGSSGTMTPQPAGTSGQTPAQPPAQPPAAAAPAAQADEQAARRHLTEARNTLSALTQLPAASQLTGDTRTQVSQLISNFNELITAQASWKSSYDKVTANMTALIGPDMGTPDPSTAGGTQGAVGTTGAASTLDPSIRAKLVELRRQLSDFEKAASGEAATAASNPDMTSNPSTATPPSTAPETAPPSAAPPATAQDPAMAAAGNADLMRHVAAIEALLKSEDDSGGLTLTKAQVEQLRTHWAALKAALDKK